MEELTKPQYATSETRIMANQELRILLKEVIEIGNADAPRNIKQSEAMKHLFDLEKTVVNHWIDQYHGVRRAIENEILFRVRTDKF